MQNYAARWPKISIVTPSFNQAEYIEKTILSVLDQGYPNLEYIIMDGGSDDGSAEIIERYSDHLAYWQSQPDEGQTDALAKGFEKSTGDIQGWLCSDDLLEPHTLQEVAKTFTRNPDWQVAYGDSLWIDGEDNPIQPKKEIPFNRFIWMYDYNYLSQPSTFWRRELYEKVGGLDPSFNLAMDADLWARFAEHTGLHHVPRRWSRIRFYPEQKNQRLRDRSDEEDAAIRARYLPNEPPWSQRTKKVLAKGMRVALKLRRRAYW
ncbi:glycosyltransferase family 2 protein [Rubrobacter aplysinae]|uniref:glycosyltransferase family 2 protein n=1 Tax=Rubrobacter aplysinae TaxID=909625 RepID=UPI00069D36EF|nr:glycosyltransferase family 2 protein [Rubrobacter aplysinae]